MIGQVDPASAGNEESRLIFLAPRLADKPAPELEVGSYARTANGIVYLVDGGNTDGFWAANVGYDKDAFYRPIDLSRWAPRDGEFVIEKDNETSPIGVILGATEGISVVKWPDFDKPQCWRNVDLEPAWDVKPKNPV